MGVHERAISAGGSFELFFKGGMKIMFVVKPTIEGYFFDRPVLLDEEKGGSVEAVLIEIALGGGADIPFKDLSELYRTQVHLSRNIFNAEFKVVFAVDQGESGFNARVSLLMRV